MKSIFICWSLIIVLFDNTRAHQTCMTPDNKNGICIPLRSCSSLFQIILNLQTSTQNQRDFLKRSQCGYDNRNPLVCCPVTLSRGSISVSERVHILPKPGVCGIGAGDKIYGGTKTSITEFPWMALIQYSRTIQGRQQKDYLCGGSLINKNTVVTAGHCVAGGISQAGWKPITVRLGENDLRTSPDCDGTDCADPELDVGISEIIVHEDFEPSSKTQYNDIALIRLSRSVQFTTFIRPVCLPIAEHLRNINYDNEDLTVAGFGRTENGKSSDFKLKLEIPGFNWHRCNSIYQQQTRTTLISTQLCAGGLQDEDSCNGDSGGPLVAVDDIEVPYTYLVGVVSRGPKICGTKDFPGVYTRVSEYIDWIANNIRE